MFLLSMPLEEALQLAGFHRYLATAHLAWLVVVLWLLLAAVDATTQWLTRLLAAATGTATLVAMSALGSHSILPVPDSSDSARAKVEEALAGAEPVPAGDTVCVVLHEPDSGFRRHILRYALVSDDVEEVLITDERDPYQPERCDSFVVLEENPAADRWFAERGITPPGPVPYLVEWSR
jgi:hypothetical protein